MLAREPGDNAGRFNLRFIQAPRREPGDNAGRFGMDAAISPCLRMGASMGGGLLWAGGFYARATYGLSTSNARSIKFGSPVFSPYKNQRTRCSLEPCVNASGTM